MNTPSPSPSASPTSSEGSPARKPRAKLVNWLLILLILLALGLAGGVTAFVFRSVIKAKVWTWRAQGQVRRAEQLIDAGDWPGAFQLALAAQKLDPSSAKGLRVLFRAATQTNSALSAQIASNLAAHPEATLQEKLNLLSYFDLTQNDRFFLGHFSRLDEAQRQHPDAQFLMIRFLLTRGGLDEAKKMLQAYFEAGGKERRFEGLRARVLLIGNPSEREEGLKLVANLMQAGDEVSQQAFRLLWDVPPALLQPDLYPADLHEWVSKLPNPGAKDKLVIAQFELAKTLNDKVRQDGVFRQAAADFGDSDREILCNWLTRFQRFDLILEVVDEERGRRSLALFDHRLRALTVVQGAEAAEAWLANPLPDASPLQIWLSRAKLARLRKDRPLEQKCWKEALTVAGVDETFRQFLPIFRTALGMRELDIACRALLEAAPHAGASFPTSLEIQPVIEYLYAQDRLRDLQVISERLLKYEPNNVVLLNNVIYISLILDKPVENSTALARQLVEKHPKILGLRTTLALALRREKKSQEALPILESAEADWKLASPADLTIRALILEDCGETARAEEVRRQISRKGLTISERRAFAVVFKDEPAVLDPDQLFADIRSWMIQGGQKYARQLFEEYFATGGNERRFLSLYADLLLQLHYAENDPLRGQEIVAQLLGEADDYARKAFALLASFPADLIHPSVFPPDLLVWVRNLPNPSVPETIAAAKVESLRAPDSAARDLILSHLVTSTGKSAPGAVAALLAELERFDLLLTLLDEKTAATSPELRDYRLQALLKLQGTDAARQWLEASRGGDETPEAWLSTAKLRHSLGDAPGTLTALREASSLAQRDQTANHFMSIYRTALELGQIPAAIRALLSASLHPQAGVPAMAELSPILASLYGSDRLDDLHTLARTLLNQDPGNDTLRCLEAYLSLILSDPTSRALDVTEDLLARHPHILGFRTTRALALTIGERYEEALQVLPQETEPWDHSSAVDLAILALVQENAGDAAAAAATRARFEQDDLTPRERRALAAAKRKLPAPAQEQPPNPPPSSPPQS